jgi:NlpC/P60 family putative phage cell wall peptidase
VRLDAKPFSPPAVKLEGHLLPQGERAARELLVATARSWIGTPYKHQGALRGIGCDCLGLIVGVWRELGGEFREAIPAYTPDWAEAMRRETLAEGFRAYLGEIDVRDATAGDVVLFRWRAHLPAKHAAILSQENWMVHAQDGASVSEVPLSDWWRRRMAYAFSFRHQGSLPRRKVAAKQLDDRHPENERNHFARGRS